MDSCANGTRFKKLGDTKEQTCTAVTSALALRLADAAAITAAAATLSDALDAAAEMAFRADSWIADTALADEDCAADRELNSSEEDDCTAETELSSREEAMVSDERDD